MTVIDYIEAFKHVMREMNRIELDKVTREHLARQMTKRNPTFEMYIFYNVVNAVRSIKQYHCSNALLNEYVYYYCIVCVYHDSYGTCEFKTNFGQVTYTINKYNEKRREIALQIMMKKYPLDYIND